MKKPQNYTPEFRQEAVKAILEQNLSLSEASRRMSIPKGTLANWMASCRSSIKKGIAAASAERSDLMKENIKLRKELVELKLERDILKKAAAYFAKESLPGTRS